MSYYSFLMVMALVIAYYGSKYELCRQSLSRLPTLKEVRSFAFEDKLHRRNARAVKICAVFFALLGLLSLRFQPGFSDLINNDEFVRVLLKLVLLIVLLVNFYFRYVLYRENNLQKKKFSVPLWEMIDVFVKTGVFVKGKVSLAVNITTLICLLLPVIIYIYL